MRRDLDRERGHQHGGVGAAERRVDVAHPVIDPVLRHRPDMRPHRLEQRRALGPAFRFVERLQRQQQCRPRLGLRDQRRRSRLRCRVRRRGGVAHRLPCRAGGFVLRAQLQAEPRQQRGGVGAAEARIQAARHQRHVVAGERGQAVMEAFEHRDATRRRSLVRRRVEPLQFRQQPRRRAGVRDQIGQQRGRDIDGLGHFGTPSRLWPGRDRPGPPLSKRRSRGRQVWHTKHHRSYDWASGETTMQPLFFDSFSHAWIAASRERPARRAR